jgi:GNAT superfamily N-acetyltransferase
MRTLIRPARTGDIAALVRLRLANAQRHIELDSSRHRRPEASVVRQYFQDVLSSSATTPTSLILVAELSGEVVGMVEVVIAPDPPEHQILIPRRTAQIHTVILDGYRSQGIGKALVREAEQLAAKHGVTMLIAPIFAPNANAVSFYSGAGFAQHGVLLSKEPAATVDDADEGAV